MCKKRIYCKEVDELVTDNDIACQLPPPPRQMADDDDEEDDSGEEDSYRRRKKKKAKKKSRQRTMMGGENDDEEGDDEEEQQPWKKQGFRVNVASRPQPFINHPGPNHSASNTGKPVSQKITY